MEIAKFLQNANIFAGSKNVLTHTKDIPPDEQFKEIMTALVNTLEKVSHFGCNFVSVDAQFKNASTEKKILENERILLEEQIFELQTVRSKLEADIRCCKDAINEEKEKSRNLAKLVLKEQPPESTVTAMALTLLEKENSEFASADPETISNENIVSPIITPKVKRILNTSPIVKSLRSNKRKLSISSKKWGKDAMCDTDECTDNSTNLPGFKFEMKTKTDAEDVPNDANAVDAGDLSDDITLVEASPVPACKYLKGKNLFFDAQLDIIKIEKEGILAPVSLNTLNNRKSPLKKSPKDNDFTSVSRNPLSNRKSLLKKLPEDHAQISTIGVKNEKPVLKTSPNEGESNDKGKEKKTWKLRKSRDIKGNKKLVQTTLASVVPKPKIDLSTQEEYRGGLIPSNVNSSMLNTNISTIVDPQETFFDPSAFKKYSSEENEDEIFVNTSTVNNRICSKPAEKVKISAIEKMKPVETNSFDCLPCNHDSPEYKYRRDTVRKKSERCQLPGQTGPCCAGFYVGETQANKIQLVSRHRDKYPIYANTPPGLWNPKIDTDDEEN